MEDTDKIYIYIYICTSAFPCKQIKPSPKKGLYNNAFFHQLFIRKNATSGEEEKTQGEDSIQL